MGDFFRGWRRKAGLVTLVMALTIVAGSVRCHSIEDQIEIRIWNADHFLASKEGGIRWTRIAHESKYQFVECGIRWDSWVLPPPSTLTLIMGGGQKLEGDSDFDIGFLPYWSVVLPLTLVSGWLVLTKSRPAKPPVNPTEPI